MMLSGNTTPMVIYFTSRQSQAIAIKINPMQFNERQCKSVHTLVQNNASKLPPSLPPSRKTRENTKKRLQTQKTAKLKKKRYSKKHTHNYTKPVPNVQDTMPVAPVV